MTPNIKLGAKLDGMHPGRGGSPAVQGAKHLDSCPPNQVGAGFAGMTPEPRWVRGRLRKSKFLIVQGTFVRLLRSYEENYVF